MEEGRREEAVQTLEKILSLDSSLTPARETFR